MIKGWIGVDLDGTAAYYEGWSKQGDRIGEPIPAMIERIRLWLSDGQEVRIFTARAGQDELIWAWLEKIGLPRLPITNIKDPYMIALWDDRCVQVITNTGNPVVTESVDKIPAWGSSETA